jgi:hypothetical protein
MVVGMLYPVRNLLDNIYGPDTVENFFFSRIFSRAVLDVFHNIKKTSFLLLGSQNPTYMGD